MAQIPYSVAASYDSALEVAESLSQVVLPRLTRLCRENHWLLDHRIKSLESCLSKLEAGSEPLSSLHDFFAATIVVPTQAYISKAVAVVGEEFETEAKPTRTSSPDSFLYDDVHLISCLGAKVSPRGVHEKVRQRKFEIQVKTGLQFAWWRATHEQIYKSAEVSSHQWAIQRASGQAKAALELLDGVLSDLPTAGTLQRAAPFPDDYRNDPEKWLTLWRKSDWPIDVHRFCTTTLRWMDAASISSSEIFAELKRDHYRELIVDREITPSQVILICLSRIVGEALPGLLKAAGIKVFVTPELLRRYPVLQEFPTK